MTHAGRAQGRAAQGVPAPGRLKVLAELAPPWPVRRARLLHGRSRGAARKGRPAYGLRPARASSATSTPLLRACSPQRASTSLAPDDQRCCGALHLHAGRREEGHRRAHALGERFAREGVDAVVVNAAGCGSHLKDSALDVRVVDVSELLAEVEPRAERAPLPLKVAFQDACHLLHAQRVRDAPREVLGSIPGVDLVEPAEQAICCGSAGIYNLVEPEAATELGDRKAAHVTATGAEVYASANPGCLVQVSTALRRAGKALPAVHPVELVDASIRGVSVGDVVAGARR